MAIPAKPEARSSQNGYVDCKRKALGSTLGDVKEMDASLWRIGVVMLFSSFSTQYACPQGYSPEEAVQRMTVADGFEVDAQ